MLANRRELMGQGEVKRVSGRRKSIKNAPGGRCFHGGHYMALVDSKILSADASTKPG